MTQCQNPSEEALRETLIAELNGPVAARQRQLLHTAWNEASRQVRKEFLAKILAPLDREPA